MSKSIRWFLFLALMPVLMPAQDVERSVVWLPPERVVPPFPGNARDHSMSLARILKDNQYVGGFGAFFPVVDLPVGNELVQFGIGSTLYTQFIRSSSHLEVVNADFFVDFVADYQLSAPAVLRGGLGHSSQHLVDDAIEILRYGHSINYVRDYLQFFLIHRLSLIRGFAYGGFYYHYRFRIPQTGTVHWLFQAGGEAFDTPVTNDLTFYTAFDVKFREESGYATTQNYQMGIRLKNSTGKSVRLAYTYRAGLEERGQFYTTRAYGHLLGVYFDF